MAKVYVNDNIMNELEEILLKRLEKVGQYVENKAKENITNYRAVQTSFLKNSVDHDVNDSELKVRIGTNTEYAVPVHEGHGRLSGRPFLQDAVDDNYDVIQNILGRE